MKATDARIRLMKKRIAIELDRHHATAEEASSALAWFLIEIFIDARQRNDQKTASEMRRMAQRLTMLADAPAAEMAELSQLVADGAVC